MFEAVTIFCSKDDPSLAFDVVSESGGRVSAIGTRHDWEELRVEWDGRELAMTRKMFEPASEFSHIILGAHNFFRSLPPAKHPEKERVLSFLERCDMMLGVQADPPVSLSETRFQCVLRLAETLDGMIFNGREMLDPTGKVIFGA